MGARAGAADLVLGLVLVGGLLLLLLLLLLLRLQLARGHRESAPNNPHTHNAGGGARAPPSPSRRVANSTQYLPQ